MFRLAKQIVAENLIEKQMFLRTSSPVTLGSKVPECPVLSTLRIRLIHATTSCELGFEGLSKLIKPDLMYSLMSRLSGEEPCGNGEFEILFGYLSEKSNPTALCSSKNHNTESLQKSAILGEDVDEVNTATGQREDDNLNNLNNIGNKISVNPVQQSNS
uniref:Uncharacterized protein n=1 Tax=Glossina pallidipes TaxID=7398 RepID=A0A1A9ZQV3_GLOPL